MKIGVLNCLKANECCTGAACLNALNSRKRSFERYSGKEISLVAFARCNGCGKGIDAGFTEKLDRIVSEGTEVVHLGICTNIDGRECPTMTKVADYLQSHGIEIIRGTH